MTAADQVPVDTSKAIHRRTGKNFYVATRLFPQRVRHATYALYGFFRVADDVVDDPDALPPDEQRRELARVRAAALGETDTDDPVLAAFRAVADETGIDDSEIGAFLDAMAMDVEGDRYETYEDLEAYLRGSAVAVAYMMLDVMGAADRERARPHARALGEAFQLTNFVRDVREDVQDFGRIYLPLATLERYGVSESEVEQLSFSPAAAAAVEHELRRAERRYRDGVAGIEYLPADCQFPVLLAAVLYAEHHRLIRRRGFDVFSERATLSRRHRLLAAARTWWHWRRNRDPVEVFEAVSAVPPEPDDGPEVESARDRPGVESAHDRPGVESLEGRERSAARETSRWSLSRFLP